MMLRLLLTAVALVPATLARSWGGRDFGTAQDNVTAPVNGTDQANGTAQVDAGDEHPVGRWLTTTTTWVQAETSVTVSTVVFVEHLYTTPGISTWENFSPDGFASTSTTFTTTTVTHIPHVIYRTSDWSDAQHIALGKRSTVSVTDWVTVTEGPGNPEVTSESSSSSETTTSTSTPVDAPQTSPSSSLGTGPSNSSTSAFPSPSSSSTVSGAPPITSSVASEASSATRTSSSEPSSRSTSLVVPPVPVTPTAPIPSDSMTIPFGPPTPGLHNTTSHRGHPSTLLTLTTGFVPPEESTITFVMASHTGTAFSRQALATGKENGPVEERGVASGDENKPPEEVQAPTITAPFTLTLTSPPTLSTSVRCDNSWCGDDGTVYCMRWDGSSGINSFGIVTPGEVFTTAGLCTPKILHGASQVSTLAGEPTATAVSRHGP